VIAAFAALTRAQESLIAALDGGRVEEIEASARALGASLATVRSIGAWQSTPEAHDMVRRALKLVDAAAIRTNFLADQAQRRLEMVMRARGDAPRIGYTRMAQGLA
jgi:hypothetical protein